MKIDSLELHHFRNHSHLTLKFKNGITTIVGRNGLGKTNIIEAIYYTSSLGSHRVNSDDPLIEHGCDSAQINVTATKHNRQAKIQVNLNKHSNNSVQLNGSIVRRPRDIVGVLQVVVFSPEDLDLVKGDPAVRRKFIDTFMMLYAPRVADIKQSYERALKQRNSLLKSAGRKKLSDSASQTLEVWDEQITKFGAQLVEQRMKGLNLLKPFVQSFGDVISGETESFDVTYSSHWLNPESKGINEIEGDLKLALVNRRNDEIDRGITLSGPHRDDLTILLSGNPVKGYASHGQAWSTAIALKLATFHALREHEGDPILILDDVFAELDQQRRNRLANLITNIEQVIITVADIKDVPEVLTGTHLWLEDGAHHA